MSSQGYRMTPGGEEPPKGPPPAPAVTLTRSQAKVIEGLYTRFYTDVYRAARRRAWSSPQVAEDATQRTFLKLMHNWSEHCDDAPEEVRGWLLGTVRNTVLEEHRAGKRFAKAMSVWPEVDISLSAEDEMISGQPSEVGEIKARARERIRELLAGAPHQLAVIELGLDGKSDRAIANELGISETNVRVSRFKARTKLNSDQEMSELRARLREASK